MILDRSVLFSMLFCFVLLAGGCETTKGVAQGIGKGVGYTVEGVARDTKNAWQMVLKADRWIKNSLW